MMKTCVYALCLVVILGAATVVHSQALFTRLACEVLDHNDQPVKDAVVTATTPDYPNFKASKKTNKRGQCVISVSDPNPIYKIVIEMEGFQTLEAEEQLKVGELTKRTYKLSPSGQSSKGEAVKTADEISSLRGGSRNVRLYNEGVEAQQAGDLETAMANFKASIEADPSFAPAHTGLATAAMEVKSYAEAAAAAEKALELDPKDYQALQLRYDAYIKLGDRKKADAAAKDLKAAGDVTEVALRVFHDGVAAFGNGEVDVAKARFRQALDLDPEMVEAYANLAQIYNKEDNAAQAAEMSEETLKRDPGNMIVLKIRYDAYNRLGDAEGAKRALADLVAADPEWASVDLFNHAQELFNSNQIEAARSVLDELLKIRPDHAEAHYVMGLCLNSLADLKTATIHFEKFLELAPDHEMAPIAEEILSYIR
jgi:tetratricopeptide (TPR) repeat protein